MSESRFGPYQELDSKNQDNGDYVPVFLPGHSTVNSPVKTDSKGIEERITSARFTCKGDTKKITDGNRATS